jgi:hypothetical protein
MRLFIAAFLSLSALAALPTHAADEPDAVYGKYHRAAAAGDLDGMAQYAQAAQRAELLAMSAAQKSAMVKMLAVTMPRAYAVRNKSVAPDGKSARLVVSGPGEGQPGEKPEMLYGTVRMTVEGGEWKVGETQWTNNAPAGLASAPAAAKSAAPAPAKAAAPAAKQAIPARGGAALVGSTSAPPERKLGTAKEPCVYKPVMSAEDLENCR